MVLTAAAGPPIIASLMIVIHPYFPAKSGGTPRKAVKTALEGKTNPPAERTRETNFGTFYRSPVENKKKTVRVGVASVNNPLA